MTILRIFFCIAMFWGIIPSAFGQTPEQKREIEQINADIEKGYQEIAKNYAYSAIDNFFIGRVKYIHQTNQECLSLFNQVSNLSGQLSQPKLFNQTYSSPEQAYAALETLTTLVLYDRTILDQMEDLQDDFKFQKENINETKKLLTIPDQKIIIQFPRPPDLKKDYGYSGSLIAAYHEFVNKYGSQFSYFISKCGTANLELDQQIQKRTQFFSDFSKKLGDYYVKNSTDKYMDQMNQLAKPRADVSLLVNVQSALDRLDRKYRDAALYEKDYLKSMSFIRSYESISFIILTRILPLGANDSERAQAQILINQRIQKAKDFEKILKKQKPSEWLQQRYELTKTDIASGKKSCNTKCKQLLEQVEKMVSASKLLELQSNDSIYIALGNQALDNIQ